MSDYKKIHREEKFKASEVHICKDIVGNEGLHVAGSNGKWFLIDETVRIVGHEDCAYATGIDYCPLCGEKLVELK